MPFTCIRTWFSVVHKFRQEKEKKIRCHAALCITLTREYQICVTHDKWQKSESGGFSAAVWMCPCLSICLSWLYFSAPSIGCVCLFLPLPVTLLSFSQRLSLSLSLDWSPLNKFPLLLRCLSLSPSLSRSSFNTMILSLWNLTLLLPIPDGLTYITHFTVTL